MIHLSFVICKVSCHSPFAHRTFFKSYRIHDISINLLIPVLKPKLIENFIIYGAAFLWCTVLLNFRTAVESSEIGWILSFVSRQLYQLFYLLSFYSFFSTLYCNGLWQEEEEKIKKFQLHSFFDIPLKNCFQCAKALTHTHTQNKKD